MIFFFYTSLHQMNPEYRNKSYIFGNKILVRLHYLMYDSFNSWNSIRPLLTRRSMRNEYNYLTNFTESSFSWQLLISLFSPLRQVVYPSSKVNFTSVPETTWQTQNYHMLYIWSFTQQKNCTIILELACTVQ